MTDAIFRTFLITYIVTWIILLTLSFKQDRKGESIYLPSTIFACAALSMLAVPLSLSSNETWHALKDVFPNSIVPVNMEDEDRGPILRSRIGVTVASVTAGCDVSIGNDYELPVATRYRLIIVGQASKPQYRYLVNLVGLDTCVKSLLISRDDLAAVIIATSDAEHTIRKINAKTRHRQHILDREIASAQQTAQRK